MTSPAPAGGGRAWVRAAGTALGLLLLIYLIRQQSWTEIAAALAHIPGWVFALSIVLALLSRVAVVARWWVLLRGAGAEIRWQDAMRLTFAGLFASNFLPTTIGGDVVRLAGSLRLEGPAAVYAASIAVDRLVGMAGMVSAAPLGLPAFLPWLRGASGTLALPPMIGGIMVVWGRVRDWAQRALRSVGEALRLWVRQPKWLAGAFACTWAYMLLKFAALALFFQYLGEPIPFTQVAGLWSLVYFITLVPISIGGLGLQEVSASLIYSQVGGVSLSAALAAALLLRTVEVLASLPGALFVSDLMAVRRPPSEASVDARPGSPPVSR
jgi:uncharacterized membrane protein YbhN (UPF0104 family)